MLSHPDVHTVLPSFSTFDELGAYVALSGKKLQANDVTMLNDYKKVLGHTYCRHACGICEEACPHNIPINILLNEIYSYQFPNILIDKTPENNIKKVAELLQ